MSHDRQNAGAAAGGQASMSCSILVIGVGNEYRSDDGLGIYVARELRLRKQSCVHCALRGVTILEHSGEGISLVNAWEGYDHVFIIDAVRSGKNPGTIIVLDVLSDRIPRHMFAASSHAFGIGEAIEMARNIGSLPKTLKLYAIEAETFEPGTGLSESVVRNVAELMHLIEQDIGSLVGIRVGTGAI